jgi:hypothetical protein
VHVQIVKDPFIIFPAVCVYAKQVPLQAARRRASERIIHYLLLLLKRDGALGYLFLRRTADRRMDGQTDELLLPSTFNNEKRSRAFLMCTDTTHSLEMCNAKPIFSGVYINKALHYQR